MSLRRLWFISCFYCYITLSHQDMDCSTVCQDLDEDDLEPVCMMYSRYKSGFEYFVNLCHARRTMCQDKLILQMVNPNRCVKSNQFFMHLR